MRLFGLQIGRAKAAVPIMNAVNTTGLSTSTLWGTILESFPGAWQRNITVESTENVMKFSAAYACISLISSDIAKLRIKVVKNSGNGIWVEVTDSNSPFVRLFRKPNRFQTRIQFLQNWMTSKLMYGNTYVYKERHNRGDVSDLYILDPRRVKALVASDGAVYYQIACEPLAGLQEPNITVPASEVIHDRNEALWHPLVGVTPVTACAASATQGIKIQNNSSKFFENMCRPSGHLTSDSNISDETVARLKKDFEEKFSGGNLGRLLVTGSGLKYEPMTIPANDAQLIEQLKWTIEDVARCFHVPMHKLGGQGPTFNNVGQLNNDYYSQCLQIHIEAIEVLLDEACGFAPDTGTELDLDGLLRMDQQSLAETNAKEIQAGYLAPNEARLKRNLPPVAGGDTPYLQQQNFSLSALDKRDSLPNPFIIDKPTPAHEGPPPAASDAPTAPPALPAPKKETDDTEAFAGFLDVITKGLEHVE